MNKAIILPLLAASVLLALCAAAADDTEYRYWPVQKVPKGLVSTHYELFKPDIDADRKAASADLGPEHMLAQSLGGLTAMAVNEGRFDEMIYVGLKNPSYEHWYADIVKRLSLEERGSFGPWELLERYKDKGIYDGYILYTYDASEGNPTEITKGMDESSNVATSLAGVLKGVLIADGMQARAEAMGLKMLADVRGKTDAYTFENCRDKLNRHYALAQGPRIPHNRAIAIAHRMMVFFGTDSPTPEIYGWLEPLSSILGWNGGDEGGFVAQLSRYGHILLPSNWSLNLALLSAGSESIAPARTFKICDPKAIDWNYKGSAASFIMSDGDNVQWLMGDFCFNKEYWASPDNGVFPIGWALPYACLDQTCPDVLNYLSATQPSDSTLNLHAGGYYYPDLLGENRGPGMHEEILTRHARQLNAFMKRSGGTTLQFLVMDVNSPEALKSYEIFAREIEHLTGMFVVQYYPYEGGDGMIFWVKNAEGIDIPAVTTKYSIWANLKAERSGTPAKIAHLINKDAKDPRNPLFAWTVVHTWSGFKEIEGDDEEAENATFMEEGTHAAVTPTKWCVDRIDKKACRVVTPEEMLWRIRMHYRPEQTQALLGKAEEK